jgi:hypothetical protein
MKATNVLKAEHLVEMLRQRRGFRVRGRDSQTLWVVPDSGDPALIVSVTEYSRLDDLVAAERRAA